MLANHHVIVVGSEASGSWAVQELTEGGLKVVLFEVETRRSHADPAGPSLAENLEVNR